jgi:hypothetical protein
VAERLWGFESPLEHHLKGTPIKHLEFAFAFFPMFFGLLGTTSSGQTSKQSFAGMRLLPNYEADVYGPLVFPDEVQKFLDFEIDYLRKRQNASIQVTLNGKPYIQWCDPSPHFAQIATGVYEIPKPFGSVDTIPGLCFINFR